MKQLSANFILIFCALTAASEGTAVIGQEYTDRWNQLAMKTGATLPNALFIMPAPAGTIKPVVQTAPRTNTTPVPNTKGKESSPPIFTPLRPKQSASQNRAKILPSALRAAISKSHGTLTLPNKQIEQKRSLSPFIASCTQRPLVPSEAPARPPGAQLWTQDGSFPPDWSKNWMGQVEIVKSEFSRNQSLGPEFTEAKRYLL